MKMGLAIARRREELGMTQEELAKAVGVNKASISRWESGDISNMRRDRIMSLANALRVSPLALLAEETEGLKDETPEMNEVYAQFMKTMKKENAPDDEIRSEILNMVRNLSDSQAEHLRDFLKGMLPE